MFVDKPKIIATSVAKRPPSDSRLDKSVVRVSNKYIDASKTDPSRFVRNMCVVVINRENRRKIVATIRGENRTGNEDRLSPDQVALNYDSRDLLGLTKDLVVPKGICVRPAHWWEVYAWFWKHPDPAYKISTRLALVSAVVGVFSFLQALTTLFF